MKTKQKQDKKSGGFRARWGGSLGHLTWPLNTPKRKTTPPQGEIKKNKEGLGPSEVALRATSLDP